MLPEENSRMPWRVFGRFPSGGSAAGLAARLGKFAIGAMKRPSLGTKGDVSP